MLITNVSTPIVNRCAYTYTMMWKEKHRTEKKNRNRVEISAWTCTSSTVVRRTKPLQKMKERENNDEVFHSSSRSGGNCFGGVQLLLPFSRLTDAQSVKWKQWTEVRQMKGKSVNACDKWQATKQQKIKSKKVYTWKKSKDVLYDHQMRSSLSSSSMFSHTAEMKDKMRPIPTTSTQSHRNAACARLKKKKMEKRYKGEKIWVGDKKNQWNASRRIHTFAHCYLARGQFLCCQLCDIQSSRRLNISTEEWLSTPVKSKRFSGFISLSSACIWWTKTSGKSKENRFEWIC